ESQERGHAAPPEPPRRHRLGRHPAGARRAGRPRRRERFGGRARAARGRGAGEHELSRSQQI
ncbi:MAG: hypothetical protein AVDCRST_MAG68-4747, partial [uncultured Gemmatimonadetes bacterium]